MFQPTTSADQIRAIAKDRLIKPLAERWPPMARQSEEAQQRELADLTRDVVDLLPARESAESLALIVDRAWTTLRRTHRGVTWPKSATVCDAVDSAVADWRTKSGAANKDRLPQRPTLPSPKVCTAKADHFRELGATALADYSRPLSGQLKSTLSRSCVSELAIAFSTQTGTALCGSCAQHCIQPRPAILVRRPSRLAHRSCSSSFSVRLDRAQRLMRQANAPLSGAGARSAEASAPTAG